MCFFSAHVISDNDHRLSEVTSFNNSNSGVSMALDITDRVDVLPLGGGQDVGRSCLLLRVRGKHVLLDCGAHLAYHDARRFPDFTLLLKHAARPAAELDDATESPYTRLIDCLVVTHFHLDHCGALPMFTEHCGYNGPIYMTAPTKALIPVLLEDFHRLQVERRGQTNFFTKPQIGLAMQKVRCMQVHEEVWIDPELSIQAFYAGHVLGAVMFLIRIHTVPPCAKCARAVAAALSASATSSSSSAATSTATALLSSSHAGASTRRVCACQLGHVPPVTIMYTGDFNTSSDRHLGAASLTRLPPMLFNAALTPHPLALLITESTYAATLRDSQLIQEQYFLDLVLECVNKRKGKVLIPVFALGKAQELCLLLESCWRRLQLQVPIYFAPGMTQKATDFFRTFVAWGAVPTKEASLTRNVYEFAHVSTWSKEYKELLGPAVLFATPGMLQAGTICCYGGSCCVFH
jgi:integrator complex subunit 11